MTALKDSLFALSLNILDRLAGGGEHVGYFVRLSAQKGLYAGSNEWVLTHSFTKLDLFREGACTDARVPLHILLSGFDKRIEHDITERYRFNSLSPPPRLYELPLPCLFIFRWLRNVSRGVRGV
jgi:hypothetical protein